MDHGATALKDGKYLEAKDIANEALQTNGEALDKAEEAQGKLKRRKK